MYTDTIADFLTRIRNAQAAGHRIVEIPNSKIKSKITEILYNNGYIFKYTVDKEALSGQGMLKIALKYDSLTKQPAISQIQRMSKPGLRKYSDALSIPKTMSGLGLTIVSTSKGIMTDKEARKLNIGGELICSIA
jgi:small subunit ribosomal protein S8